MAFVALLAAEHGTLATAPRGTTITADAAVVLPRPPAFQATTTATPQSPSTVEAALNLDRTVRRVIQQGLRNDGFDPGAPDGLFGPRTRGSIRRWQEARGVPATGYLNGPQAAQLRLAGTPVAPAEGAVASADGDLAPPDEGDVNPLLLADQYNENSAEIVAADGGFSHEPQFNPDGNMPAAQATPTAQLPPETLVDRHLLRVRRLLAENDAEAAHAEMDEIVRLQQEHDLVLPDDFLFRYAQVTLAAGLPEIAIASLNDYLLAAGREGEFYRDALELLDSAEETLRRVETERRRAAAERRIQQASDELVRRQLEAAAQSFPRDTLRSGGFGPEMVSVPTGRFQYAYVSWRDPQWVLVERPFAISKYEVTLGEFRTFTERSRYLTEAERAHDDQQVCDISFPNRPLFNWRSPGFAQADNHPVTCVTVRDAVAYAEWLSQETGQNYRLPSSAEWQYAARAGSREAMLYLPPDGDRNSCGRGNLEEHPRGARTICTDGVSRTAAVGRFPPNSIGIHDMIGNVAEWVLACGHSDPFRRLLPPRDGAPEDPLACDYPLALGPSFENPAYAWYTWTSGGGVARDTWTDMGFRVVRDLDTERTGSRCQVGQILGPDQSCEVSDGTTFRVRDDGYGCLDNICAGGSVLEVNEFKAARIPDTSRWRIDALPEA